MLFTKFISTWEDFCRDHNTGISGFFQSQNSDIYNARDFEIVIFTENYDNLIHFALSIVLLDMAPALLTLLALHGQQSTH